MAKKVTLSTLILWSCLPTPAKLQDILERVGLLRFQFVVGEAFLYSEFWRDLKVQVIAYHRKELLALDHRERLRDAEDKLIRAREAARDAGMEASDPNYPSLFDFIELPDFSKYIEKENRLRGKPTK